MHKFQGKGTIFLQDNPCLRIKKRRAYFVLPADYTIFASVIKPMIQDDKKDPSRFDCYPGIHSDFFRLLLPDRKSTRLNSSHMPKSRMPSSA